VARRAPEPPSDPILVLVDDAPIGDLDTWLRRVTADGPTETNADAAQLLREIREQGET